MGRGATAVALAAVIGASSLGGVASAGEDAEHDTYTRFAKIRDQVRACVLDQGYKHLGQEKRRTCKRYRSLYVLYIDQGESSRFQFHCLTSRCPRAPLGAPDPRAPIPPGAKVYRP